MEQGTGTKVLEAVGYCGQRGRDTPLTCSAAGSREPGRIKAALYHK